MATAGNSPSLVAQYTNQTTFISFSIQIDIALQPLSKGRSIVKFIVQQAKCPGWIGNGTKELRGSSMEYLAY